MSARSLSAQDTMSRDQPLLWSLASSSYLLILGNADQIPWCVIRSRSAARFCGWSLLVNHPLDPRTDRYELLIPL